MFKPPDLILHHPEIQTISRHKMVVYAAIEGGGTAWKVAIVSENLENVLEEAEFETLTPELTLGSIRSWLAERQYDAVGVGSFGPVDARKDSSHYGFITTTPKPGWKNTDVLGLLGLRNSAIPVLFDTDVNAPAMAEYLNCMEQGHTSCAYITVGTGIGVGIVVNGQTIKGLMHPEGGHIPVIRHPDDHFQNSCSFHQHCLEGYCNNVSVAQRLGIDRREVKNVADDHPVWSYLAFYLAQLCANLVSVYYKDLFHLNY